MPSPLHCTQHSFFSFSFCTPILVYLVFYITPPGHNFWCELHTITAAVTPALRKLQDAVAQVITKWWKKKKEIDREKRTVVPKSWWDRSGETGASAILQKEPNNSVQPNLDHIVAGY